MVEVIVEYDYSANESDELTIKKGDIIRDVIRKSGGWWDGVLNEKRGLFPDNFVRLMDKESVPFKTKKDFIQTRQCRVIFSYKQDHPDELSLNVGDIINIISEEEEGWWRGVLQGKEGVFPSNFVEEIKPKFSSREDLTSLNDSKSPVLLPKRSKILCQVKYSYKAQNEDELSLKEGDIINVICKEGLDPGWWKGELNSKVGVFPDNFVTIISNIDEKVNKDSTDSAILKPTVFLQRKSVEENHNNRNIPPIPSKKPLIPIKKSPSGSSSPSGLLAGLRKKIVDGTTSSKTLTKSNEILEEKQDAVLVNVFDQVERTCMLPDVRATRAKAPGRRPPSTIFKENELEIVNGNVNQSDIDGMEDSTCFYSTNNKSSEEIKPKLRGWEKHKAPWLEEMKLNQAKRTSVSPGSEPNKLKITNSDISVTSDTDNGLPETILSVEANSTNLNEKVLNTTNEIDKDTVLKNILPVSSFQIPQNINQTTTVFSVPSAIERSPNTEKTSTGNLDSTSSHQYNELLERLKTLELRFQQQELVHKAAIEDLQNKLQVETDMRRLLQTELDKLSQCIMQV